MSASLLGGRRVFAGLAGWKLLLLLVASLLLNLGFVLVWVLQPLPSAPVAKRSAGGSSAEGEGITGAALETRLRAAGYAEAEARKIVAAAGMTAAPSRRAGLAEEMPDAVTAVSGDTQRTSEAGAASRNRGIAIGSTGSNPAASRGAMGIQNRTSSPTLRSADASGSSPAGGSSRNSAADSGGADLPTIQSGSGGERTPTDPAPETNPISQKSSRAGLSREEQLYRSLYGWQSYNAALTEAAQHGGTP